MIRHQLLLLLLVCAITGSVAGQEPPKPEPAASLFKDRPFGPQPPPTPTPLARKVEPEEDKPIPLGWIIGGASAAVLATALLLYGSARRWHSSNLFDRQYYFPVDPAPALRFGGKKSGGHLAKVQFGTESRSPEPASKTKDA